MHSVISFTFILCIDRCYSAPFLIPEQRVKYNALIPQPVIGGIHAANNLEKPGEEAKVIVTYRLVTALNNLITDGRRMGFNFL